jgi:hypothetical protein
MVLGVRMERQSRAAEQAIEEHVCNIAAFPLATTLLPACSGDRRRGPLLPPRLAGFRVALAAAATPQVRQCVPRYVERRPTRAGARERHALGRAIAPAPRLAASGLASLVIIVVGIPRWQPVGRIDRPSALGDVCVHISSCWMSAGARLAAPLAAPAESSHNGCMGKTVVEFKYKRIAEDEWQIEAHYPGAELRHIKGFKSKAEADEWLQGSSRVDWLRSQGYAK